MSRTDLRGRLIAGFRWVGDAGTAGEIADRSGWFQDASVLQELGPALAGLVTDAAPTLVIGAERSGLLLGPLVAAALGVGFVAALKTRDDLADSDIWLSATSPVDYRGRNLDLHIRRQRIAPGDRVLLVDDWAETGGQLSAMAELVRQAGATQAGVVVIVDALVDHEVRRRLRLRSLLHLRDLR